MEENKQEKQTSGNEQQANDERISSDRPIADTEQLQTPSDRVIRAGTNHKFICRSFSAGRQQTRN